jgi:hypothetical protein
MRPRHQQRKAAREQANAALCGLPLTEYLALDRRERKRRVSRALAAAEIPFRVVGMGLFPLPGERRRMALALAEARRELSRIEGGGRG